MKTKVFGVVAAFALVLGATTTANALTTSELVDLLVSLGIIPADQAAAAQAAVGGSSTSSSSCALASAPDMTVGSQGANVTDLQNYLMGMGYSIPAGATGYFGSQTQSALAAYQAANGISPAAGYFGPVTKSKITCDSDDSSSSSSSSSSTLKGGDGDFNDFDVLGNPDSTDVEEGGTEEVMAFEFDAEDSDLLIERIDILFGEKGANTDKPWKVLETVTLEIDGDEVAEIDASDDDNWDEEENDEYSVRFNDIDTVVKENDTAKVVVSVTAQDNLDSDDLGTWGVELMNDGIRALNAEGITIYEGASDDDIDGDIDERTFTLEEPTAGDLNVNFDEDENDDRVVIVDEDEETEDEVIYFAQLESDEGDNTIEEVTVTIATTTGTTNGLSDFVKTLYLFIDGEEVGIETVSDDDGEEAIVFDDLDIEIDEDDEVDFEVRADFYDQDGNYATTTTGVFVTSVEVDYIDQNDDDQTVTETSDGGNVLLSLDSIMVEVSDVTSSYNGATATKGQYVVKFDVTAPEDDDIYIALSSASSIFEVIDATLGTATTTATTTSASLTGTSITSSHLKISEGQTKTITLTVNLDNFGGPVDKDLQVGLTKVTYKVGSTGASAKDYTAGIDEDYRTDSLILYTTNQN